MIEEVLLPSYVIKTRSTSFPVTNHGRHAWFARKSQHRVQVIGHQQEQLTPPASHVVVALRSGQQGRGQHRVGQPR